MPYKAKGKCVYKKDTGEKVGCTKGSVKKYLAALHANVPDAKNEEIKEPMKIKLSEIAKKVINENRPAPIMLNGKEVDEGSIELSTQDGQPYITAAKYIDGTNISTPDLEKLEQAIESQYEGGLRRFAGFDF